MAWICISLEYSKIIPLDSMSLLDLNKKNREPPRSSKMYHKSEHLTPIRQTYIDLHHIKHQNISERTQRIRRVPECRARGSKVPSTHFPPECRPGRCGSRCTLSFSVKKTKRNRREARECERNAFIKTPLVCDNVVSLN